MHPSDIPRKELMAKINQRRSTPVTNATGMLTLEHKYVFGKATQNNMRFNYSKLRLILAK